MENEDKKGNVLGKFSHANSNVTAFLNTGKRGPSFVTYSVDKGYKDFTSQEYRYTNSFNRKELESLVTAIQEALAENFEEKKGEQNENKDGKD